MNFIAMDLETADRHPGSACSLALVMVRNNKIINRFYTVINPQMPSDERNIQVHQATPDGVKDVPMIAEVRPRIRVLYQPGMFVVAHNARFNANVLEMSLVRYDIDEPHYPVIDILKTSRLLEPDLPDHKLNTVAEALDVEFWYHHNVLSDSEACVGILIKQNEEMGDEAIKNPIEQR